MKHLIHVLAVVAAAVVALGAQTHAPTPAFQGQTKAPPPTTPSPPLDVRVIADGLTGAWALAFLPDGTFLITQNAGTMRHVRPDGVVSEPLQGVPGV
jgi:glucose/arabinose dehydrogenase